VQAGRQGAGALEQKRLQQCGVIGAHRLLDGYTRGELMAPGLNPGPIGEEAKVVNALKNVEITENRPENSINQREILPGKVRARAQRALKLGELGGDSSRLGLQHRLIGGRIKTRYGGEDGGSKLHPRAMLRPLQGILRVQPGKVDFVQVFTDHR
jgi:hypothetical protein